MDEGLHTAAIAIDAPARLHLGFLDLEGTLGRRFGSIGLAIDGIATQLTMAPSRSLEISGPGAARARMALEQAAAALGVAALARITIQRAIPSMSGSAPGHSSALPSQPGSPGCTSDRL